MSSSEADRNFSESVSAVYEALFVPLIFQSYADDTADRLAGLRDGSILEVAAGTGVVTRAMARVLPETVSITATDLNQAMLDQAARVGTVRPVQWQQANVMSLPFESGSFDVVVCQFGVMFFDPKADAFAEIRRVLRPGGQFLFVVWDGLEDNEFAAVISRVVNELFPDDPPRFLERTPYAYHDPGTIIDDLRAGGFRASPSIEQVRHRSRAATAARCGCGVLRGFAVAGRAREAR